MVDEKDPPTGRKPAHELHAVVMDFDRIAVLIEAGDAPLRAAEGEVPGHGRVVDNNVHMWLQPDEPVMVSQSPRRRAPAAVPWTWSSRTTVASGWYIAAAASTSCALKALASQRSTSSGDGAPLTISFCSVSAFIDSSSFLTLGYATMWGFPNTLFLTQQCFSVMIWRGTPSFALFRSRRRASQRDPGREETRVAQPALSRQIQDLEEELGLQLIERSTRGIKLTEAGEFFADEARAVLARADEASQAVRALARGEIGELRVGYALRRRRRFFHER